MRPSQHAKIRPTRRENRVHVLIRRDIAHRHRGDSYLVTNAISKRRLKLPAVLRLGVGHRLAGRDVGDVAIVSLEETGDLDRIRRLQAARRPVDRRDADRHWFVIGPRRAHRVEDFEWKSHAVLE